LRCISVVPWLRSIVHRGGITKVRQQWCSFLTVAMISGWSETKRRGCRRPIARNTIRINLWWWIWLRMFLRVDTGVADCADTLLPFFFMVGSVRGVPAVALHVYSISILRHFIDCIVIIEQNVERLLLPPLSFSLRCGSYFGIWGSNLGVGVTSRKYSSRDDLAVLLLRSPGALADVIFWILLIRAILRLCQQ